MLCCCKLCPFTSRLFYYDKDFNFVCSRGCEDLFFAQGVRKMMGIVHKKNLMSVSQSKEGRMNLDMNWLWRRKSGRNRDEDVGH